MNQFDPTEDRLNTWLQEEASGELPDWVLGATFERTRHAPQRTSAWGRSRIRLQDMGRRPGRRSAMFLASRAIAVVALVALGTGVAFTLRPVSTTGPGGDFAAESTSPSASVVLVSEEATYADGSHTSFTYTDPGVLTEVDGLRQHGRGEVATGIISMSDPRLSGTFTQTFNVDEYPQPGTEVRPELHWGTFTIENDAGAWTGLWNATGYSDPSVDWTVTQYQFVGEGAYQGLSALMFETGRGPNEAYHAIIFPGELPPGR